ncbi:unnamed protein product [Paramecium pentaurelia]|uniref:Uncharacterized protein n=1 Tax=Paramecium pentaurelia TaxID=43138 RepID=A0A8S1YI01_9CILI|nr:unnamed protein product [Paramecium pentaurelia]
MNYSGLILNNIKDNEFVIDDGIQSVQRSFQWQLQKTSILIQYQKGYIKYIKDGSILNIEKQQLIEDEQSFNRNLNQIKHLTWLGQTQNNNMKVGRWNALWKGESFGRGGNYDKNGTKTGFWVEAFNHFWELSQVTQVGFYKNGLKQGWWNIKYKEQKIGGGNYTDQGLKDGEWIDLHQYFHQYLILIKLQSNNQVIFEGRYKNGIKIGYWEIMFREKMIEEFSYMLINQLYFSGFQSYNLNGIKVGKSVELIEDQLKQNELQNQSFSSIVTIGQYINGEKEGLWDINEKDKIIGGGFYQKNQKDGRWVDLEQSLDCLIIWNGEYKNGVRCYQWNSIINNEIVGGGIYDENGFKNGDWVELNQSFSKDFRSFILDNMLKVKNKGIGISNKSILEKILQKKCKQIQLVICQRGGNYNINGKQHGFWLDQHENYCEQCKISYSGEYSNGIKIGKWSINLEEQIIDGGYYNEQGMKQGIWIDLDENYSDGCQIFQIGSYQNGVKVFQWQTNYQNKIIGGGYYNEKGEKIKKWIDLQFNFSSYCFIRYQGEYQDGIKQQCWNILEKENQIGCGFYNNNGIKIGMWINLFDNFSNDCLVTEIGIYENGQKSKQWNIFYRDQVIAGGYYNEDHNKDGNWIDLYENFSNYSLIKYAGRYQNGRKILIWQTYYKQKIMQESKQQNICFRGGGFYNDNGQKNGQWIDLHENYYKYCQIKYEGMYQKGKKQGKWNTTFKNQIIGGGIYLYGKKNGLWIDLDENYNDDDQKIKQGEYLNGLPIGKFACQKFKIKFNE